jgi:hypothetical protein
MVHDELAAARDALARQDWKQAYAGLSAADDARAQARAGDLERLAIAAYMLAAPDLARLNALRSSSTATGEGRLTRRERQVLALIATGMTNRAIATALAISDRHQRSHGRSPRQQYSVEARPSVPFGRDGVRLRTRSRPAAYVEFRTRRPALVWVFSPKRRDALRR